MDEPLSSAGPTWATSTALHCDSLRCERRPDSSQGLKSRYVPQGAKERLISLVLRWNGLPAGFPDLGHHIERLKPAGGRCASWLWVPSPGVPHVRPQVRESCPNAPRALAVGRCAKDPGEKAHPGREWAL